MIVYTFALINDVSSELWPFKRQPCFAPQVSDTHPFHLPHIWSACKSPSGCELNMTSLSMDVHHSDSLFPENVSAPLSAFELKTKLKSRAEVYAAAGVNATNGDVDKNTTMCRSVNQAAYDWALNHAEASVKTRFLSNGLPLVMVDDVEAPIGITGPTWIKQVVVVACMHARTHNNKR